MYYLTTIFTYLCAQLIPTNREGGGGQGLQADFPSHELMYIVHERVKEPVLLFYVVIL